MNVSMVAISSPSTRAITSGVPNSASALTTPPIFRIDRTTFRGSLVVTKTKSKPSLRSRYLPDDVQFNTTPQALLGSSLSWLHSLSPSSAVGALPRPKTEFQHEYEPEKPGSCQVRAKSGEKPVSEKSTESISRFYSALGSPYRREIVQLLREKRRQGFKELHQALKISVGALYHHLDMLEGIVAQDSDRKYVLTDQGRSAIETLSVSEEKITAGQAPVIKETRLGFFSGELLLGRTLMNYLNADPVRSLPLAILIVAFGGWISSQTRIEPLLLFYLTPSSGTASALSLLMFPIGWLVTFLMAAILSTVVFHRRGDDLRLLNATAFAMLPLLIVPGLFFLAQLLSPGSSLGYTTIFLPIFLQAWVVCLLASAVSISKGLKLEKAAIISLSVVYLNILILLVGLQLGLF
jgi:DNA-binding transcriptional ArsR family regulator